jgi:RNA polymerase sigma-70 factor (ECF subfamily)
VSAATSTLRGVTHAEAAREEAALDAESRELVRALHGSGRAHDEACARLHAVLLRAARFEVGRRRAGQGLSFAAAEELAQDAADDALVAVLRKLDDFRGLSRFTTWAYKFALYEAAVKMRRRAWQDREVSLDPDAWSAFESEALGPEADAVQRERLESVATAIKEVLTPHQRRVLLALAVEGVPIDVLAERLSTTRGALYKTLHDARAKLRAHLEEEA